MAETDADREYRDNPIGDDDSWYDPTGPFPWQREYWRLSIWKRLARG